VRGVNGCDGCRERFWGFFFGFSDASLLMTPDQPTRPSSCWRKSVTRMLSWPSRRSRSQSRALCPEKTLATPTCSVDLEGSRSCACMPLCQTQVLDAAVKNCGPPTHNIVGKFRFLNEFIKMVSPKVSAGCACRPEMGTSTRSWPCHFDADLETAITISSIVVLSKCWGGS
jgi:hypothetical protein